MSPGFFETLGVAILRGRDFTFADTEKSTKVAIISAHSRAAAVRRGAGLGQRIRVSARPEWQDAEVVGIVSDARMFDVRSNNRAIVYTSAVQSGPASHYKCLVARAPAVGGAGAAAGDRVARRGVDAALADARVRARPHHPAGAADGRPQRLLRACWR